MSLVNHQSLIVNHQSITNQSPINHQSPSMIYSHFTLKLNKHGVKKKKEGKKDRR
jgi:hypothetical protein